MAKFIHPCSNSRLTSKFGYRTIGGKKEFHSGIDLAQVGNVPILASADGVVREIWGESVSTYGNVIFLQHTINGKRMDTTYAHLKSFSVKKGDKVKQGQVIGHMGNTGRSYGQHLHFEIHNGAWAKGQPNAIDPLPLISGMTVSQNCINLVKKWEGFQAKAYKCPAGIWTVGYGITKYANGQAVKQGDTITQAEALKLLEKQINEHASTIQTYVKVPLNQNQFDALASFQYNLGKHILKGSSLLTYLNNKQWDKAAAEMKLYNKAAGKVLQGLVNRRNDEATLFLKSLAAIDSKKLQENIVAGAKAFRVQSGKYPSREACIAALNEAHQQKYFAYVELLPGSSNENGWRYISGKYTNLDAARQAAERALLDNKINFATILGQLQ